MKGIKKVFRKVKKTAKKAALKTIIEANELTKYAEKVTKPKKGKYKVGY